MNKPVTTAEVKKFVHCDSVSKKGDVFTARRGFYYTHGRTAEKFAQCIKAELEVGQKFLVEVLDKGEVWKSFVGSAPVSKQSHWWVTFRVARKEQQS